MEHESYGLTKISFTVKIGEMLLADGLINKDQLDIVIEVQQIMKKRGYKLLIGELLTRLFNIPGKGIEDIFAKHLIFTITQLFHEILHKDTALSDRIGNIDEFIKTIDIYIPTWELSESGGNKIINAEMALVFMAEKAVSVKIPFEYIIEDQIATIDLNEVIDFVKRELFRPKGDEDSVDLTKIGIYLPAADIPSKILFVDDVESQRSLMKRLLARLGYEVKTAADANQALEILGKDTYPLVITDLHMPGMDGTELCKKIKEKHPHSVVYALSGYITSFGTSSLEDVGFDGYFCKPVSFDELKGAIQGALNSDDEI